jgi:hypothetical protein
MPQPLRLARMPARPPACTGDMMLDRPADFHEFGPSAEARLLEALASELRRSSQAVSDLQGQLALLQVELVHTRAALAVSQAGSGTAAAPAGS